MFNWNTLLKFNLKKKIYLSLLVFLIIILILIIFIVVPTIRDIKNMSNKIEEQRLDLEKKYIKGQSLKQLAENLEKIEPELVKLNQIFINQNRELEFITTLEEIAAKNNINQKINLGAVSAAENQNFKKSTLQLYTSGSFTDQMNYLLSLEALNYYININSIDLNPSGITPNGQSASGGINMLINAETFWQ